MSPDTLQPDARTRSAVESGEGSPSRPPPIPFVPTPPAQRKVAPAFFGATLVVVDALALAGAVPIAFWLRFGTGWLPTPLGIPAFAPYAASMPLVTALGLFVFRERGLYRGNRRADLLPDVVEGLRAIVALGVLLAAVAFFYRDFSFSRAFLLLYASVAGAAFVVGRRGAAAVHRGLRARGIGVQRVVLAGGRHCR